mgnify:CR=1 FL=1
MWIGTAGSAEMSFGGATVFVGSIEDPVFRFVSNELAETPRLMSDGRRPDAASSFGVPRSQGTAKRKVLPSPGTESTSMKPCENCVIIR